MTQTDDEILAAARECGFMFDHAGGSYGMIHGFAEDVADLYRAAYAAGMEAAAALCEARPATPAQEKIATLHTLMGGLQDVIEGDFRNVENVRRIG